MPDHAGSEVTPPQAPRPRPAGPVTFATLTDARVWLATVETDMLLGKWIDPAGGRVLLRDYAERWMASRADLSNRTREKYTGLIKLHIVHDDLLGSHAAARIELRIVPSLWPFWRRVVASTVEFSGSRLRTPHPIRTSSLA